MNQQPDELFRQKLEGFKKPAPATAWEKIAAAEHKKTHKGLWLKIAASLLLVTLVIYTRWQDTPVNEKVSGLINEAPVVQPNITSLPPRENNDATETKSQKETAIPLKKSAPSSIAKAEQLKTVVVSDMNSNGTETIAMSTQEIDMESPSEYTDSTLLESIYLQSSENITMVFTAKEVNEYLEKKELTEATDDTKKPSTWKKLLKKANDLTNNQDPFGELRQKKNEILALNFRNEKQRGQNKQ